MRISIEYNSSWRNSFLSGDVNEPLPKRGRGYIASMASLKKDGNYIERGITINTVMGLLNRLIGDRRKLWQARSAEGYYFKDIEAEITFKDSCKVLSNEIVFLQNHNNSYDQNSFTGSLKVEEPTLISDYSRELWGILWLTPEELYEFILTGEAAFDRRKLHPLEICEQFEIISKYKPVSNEGVPAEVTKSLKQYLGDIDYLNKKGKIFTPSLYCSALYIQMERLSAKYDLSGLKTARGGISGISKKGFTKKDFITRYVTGSKKKVWGNPYIFTKMVKGEGRTKLGLNKADGVLEIDINIEVGKARELKKMIELAGVSSFYLGKKGLAFVTRIRA